MRRTHYVNNNCKKSKGIEQNSFSKHSMGLFLYKEKKRNYGTIAKSNCRKGLFSWNFYIILMAFGLDGLQILCHMTVQESKGITISLSKRCVMIFFISKIEILLTKHNAKMVM